MNASRWTVRLTTAAQADFDNIIDWTTDRFGESQAAAYGKRLIATVDRLKGGPCVRGVRRRDDIGGQTFTLHMGQRGRHVIVFRVAEADRIVEVVRILHDAMDFSRQQIQ